MRLRLWIAAAIFLPPRPWVWIYDLVLIAIGFMSCCILPFSVALLIFWLILYWMYRNRVFVRI